MIKKEKLLIIKNVGKSFCLSEILFWTEDAFYVYIKIKLLHGKLLLIKILIFFQILDTFFFQ